MRTVEGKLSLPLQLLLVAGMLIVGCLVLFWNSTAKIERFCGNVTISVTPMNELPRLADEYDVTLQGPAATKTGDSDGVLAVATSEFTMGADACHLRGDSLTGPVMSKRLGP